MASKSLETVLSEIKLLYIENKNTLETVSLEKKYQNYQTCNLLVTEADTMIDSMIREVQGLKLGAAGPDVMKQVDTYMDMLKHRLNIKETVAVVTQLKATLAGLPTSAEIVDDLKPIYEITDVTDAVFDLTAPPQ
ncbi:Hypothetical protein MVR_LOCUS7 [uncultured virus]|nr:Hypothetical protein MVR_LOCUS7 [uncultured virus]